MGAWQTESQECRPDFRLWFVELKWSSSWPVEGLLSCPKTVPGKRAGVNTSSVFSVSLDSRTHVSQTPELLALPLAPSSLRLPLASATSLCQSPPRPASAFGVSKYSRPSPLGLCDLQPLSITAEQIRHPSFSHLTQEEQESQSPKSDSRTS